MYRFLRTSFGDRSKSDSMEAILSTGTSMYDDKPSVGDLRLKPDQLCLIHVQSVAKRTRPCSAAGDRTTGQPATGG